LRNKSHLDPPADRDEAFSKGRWKVAKPTRAQVCSIFHGNSKIPGIVQYYTISELEQCYLGSALQISAGLNIE
jgi:hypothetical protein